MNQSRLFPSTVEARAEVTRPRPLDPIRAVDEAVRSVLGLIGGGRATGSERPDVFPERLLALRHVESLPRESREVRIAPGTVVTPLALHALKQRGIILRFVSRSEVDRVRRAGEWGFAVDFDSGAVAAFRRALLEGAEGWLERESFDDLTRWLAESSERGALLLTDEASVAVWRGCQMSGVRAAAAETCDAVDRAVRRLGANLLVVEPAGKPIALLSQLASTFRRGGAPRVPDGFNGEHRP